MTKSKSLKIILQAGLLSLCLLAVVFVFAACGNKNEGDPKIIEINYSTEAAGFQVSEDSMNGLTNYLAQNYSITSIAFVSNDNVDMTKQFVKEVRFGNRLHAYVYEDNTVLITSMPTSDTTIKTEIFVVDNITFSNIGSTVKNIDLGILNFTENNIVSIDGMFKNCKNISEIDLRGVDLSTVKSMNETFAGCEDLTNVKFGNMKNLESAKEAFKGCKVLNFNSSLDKVVELPGKLKDITKMFDSCDKLADSGNINMTVAGSWTTEKLAEAFGTTVPKYGNVNGISFNAVADKIAEIAARTK